MCGICGIAGFADQALLERMTSLITHRGPDDNGIYISPDRSVGLGNCRLSIIDLSSAGHMPMSNEEGSLWITYNGEVYNFPALRAELQSRGHIFSSQTDSEVLLHGYEEWGVGLLERLNGMFAFGLLDLRPLAQGQSPTLLLARDRFGIKPLYYTVLGDQLLFGSEIKSILLDRRVQRSVDEEALHRYLAFLWVPGPETMFKGIYKLPAAHYLLWQQGRYSIHPYQELRFESEHRMDEHELIEELSTILTRSIERHLISDVPLGVFLSGGLDSSTILALVSQITGEPVTAYTIAYRPEDGQLEQSMDDAKFARLIAQHFGANYHEILVTPDIVDLLPKVVWHLDEPVADPAAIATLLICDAARQQLKVLLSGQGADEIFAGYRVHRNHRLANLVSKIPDTIRSGPMRAMVGMLPTLKDRVPGMRPGLVLAAHRYLDKLLQGATLAPEQRYVFYRSYYTDQDQLKLYSPELRAGLQDCIAGARHLEYFQAASQSDFLNQMLYVDVKTFLPELNLTYCDKLSSAASVEVRVPFLDLELVDFMARVPTSLKLRGLTSKYILKAAVKHIVPRPVIRRRKAGFGAPIRKWLRADLRPMVDDLLSEESIHKRGYFSSKAIRRMIEDDRAGIGDNSYRIWALLTLELWHRTFIDRSIAV